MAAEVQATIYEFPPFRLDVGERLLLRDGDVINLTPKSFDLLCELVERPGRLLTKEQLLQAVWPDAFVEENNLADNISKLRKALGDGNNGHRFIETIPKRGYRFLGAVHMVQGPSRDGHLENPKKETASDWESSVARTGNLFRRWPFIVFIALLTITIWAGIVYGTRIIREKFGSGQPALRPFSQLTYGGGLQSEPAWSPDGDMIAYSSDRSGNFDIWVQQISGGDPVKVTKSPAADWQPSWSPDGANIVFRSERDGGGLYVVPGLGGMERKITSFGFHPQWSPDGKRILFTSWPEYNLHKIYVVSLDGEAPREVQSEFLSQFTVGGVNGVAWYPNGQSISVWGSHATEGLGFWTIPIDGGKAERSAISPALMNDLKKLRLQHFLWAPSAKYIYFEGSTDYSHNMLWRVSVDPDTRRWLAGPERLTTETGLDTDVSLSRDGKKLAYTSGAQTKRIWSLPFDGRTGQIKGEKEAITSQGTWASACDLSPDGRRLSYGVMRELQQRWEKSLDDGRELFLAGGAAVPYFSGFPGFWSRDGTQLVTIRTRYPGGLSSAAKDAIEATVVTYPAGGGEEKPITSPTTTLIIGPMDWSADGQSILAHVNPRTSGPSSIWMLPLAAAPHAEMQARQITASDEYYLWQTRLSPDECWVSFNATEKVDKTHTSIIYVVPTAGGDWIRITDGKYWDDIPRWSSDGKTIYFTSNRDGFVNVWGIRFDTKVGRPVGDPFQITFFDGPIRMPQFDGYTVGTSRLIVNLIDASGNICILENVDQ